MIMVLPYMNIIMIRISDNHDESLMMVVPHMIIIVVKSIMIIISAGIIVKIIMMVATFQKYIHNWDKCKL